MTPEDDDEIVHVATSKEAFSKPIFIIEQGGRYYVTMALLEYDPNAPDITPEQREGVATIQRLYREGSRTGLGVAEATSQARSAGGVNTGPRPR